MMGGAILQGFGGHAEDFAFTPGVKRALEGLRAEEQWDMIRVSIGSP